MKRKSPVSVYILTNEDSQLVLKNESLLGQLRSALTGHPEIAITDKPSDADFLILFESFGFKQYKHRKTLLADPVIRKYRDKIMAINYDDDPIPFFPGLYTSLRNWQFDPAVHRSICYPKTHNREITQSPIPDDAHLFSFVGNPQSHPSRQVIVRLFQDLTSAFCRAVPRDFHSYTDAEKLEYAKTIEKSHFVLCPRGFSPATYRLFEVMEAGRCPVVISDTWVPPAGPDWSTCAIRIPERDICRLPQILRPRQADAAQMGHAARAEWDRCFSPNARFERYAEDFVDIATHLQRQTQTMEQWGRWSFRYRNKQTFAQRLVAKFLRRNH
ncbi:MAG: exostosin family protein [Planctomycetaceae bacterium]